ncbi:ABC transporter permease [Rahnella sp. AA]|uniref:ABC transporter permease n=1 Tax=Rahnella sp. AA TaxID=2057180 RepID=UPI000C326ADF|nr:ABC transporter permease [Rahnella sp. AA]PKE30729.1 ABC transporter permease [Rahnella sp. AA]
MKRTLANGVSFATPRHPLARALGHRLLLAVILLWGVSLLIFIAVNTLPGDFAATSLGRTATPEAMASIRQSLGLDKPLVTRYWHWVAQIFHGDFGLSWASQQPVSAQLGHRLLNSLWLAGASALLAVPVALLGGLFAVRYLHRLPDRLITLISLLILSLPEFFIGYLLIQILVLHVGVSTFPSTIYDGMTLPDRLSAMLLPVLTLAIAVLANMLRSARSALMSVTNTPWMETARLKGLPPLRILWKHAAPNAISPVLTVIAMNLAGLIVGAMIIEVIFVYPGVGQYMVDAVTVRDIPVVEACGLVFAAVYILLNLLVDMLAMAANPRLRFPK